MKQFICLTTVLAAVLCCGIAVPLDAEPVTGAIFTTLGDGSAVNANHFNSKCEVYLDGGPGPNAPAKAAGLPNGEYYFQVTDPSGKTLLSTDPVSNRRFKVDKGVIVAYTGLGGPVHPIGVDSDHPELGAITVRLANSTCEADFLDSPNNGGTYKVWATPVGDFVGDPAKVDNECGNGCFHGFQPSKSKSDNFKAKTGSATFCLTIEKQYLAPDKTVIPAAGWPMYVTDPLGITNTYHVDRPADSPRDGPWQVKVCGLTAGAYLVAEDTSFVPGAMFDALFVNNSPVEYGEPGYYFVWTAGKIEPIIRFVNINNGGGGIPE